MPVVDGKNPSLPAPTAHPHTHPAHQEKLQLAADSLRAKSRTQRIHPTSYSSTTERPRNDIGVSWLESVSHRPPLHFSSRGLPDSIVRVRR